MSKAQLRLGHNAVVAVVWLDLRLLDVKGLLGMGGVQIPLLRWQLPPTFVAIRPPANIR